MGAHISAAPNHQTHRSVPLKYRIDVAMSGRLGMEIQPRNMSDEEKALCRKAIAAYKEIRPVVQFGELYRLLSPYDGQGVASLLYASEDKSKAVFYWWKLEQFVNRQLPRVRMAGLVAVLSGSFLMSHGLEIPAEHRVDADKMNDYASRILYLEEVKP